MRAVLARAKGALRRPDPFARLHPSKLELVDLAVERFGARSFADLGGVWHVDGGYSFYALARGAERGVLVDHNPTPALHERARGEPRLEVVRGSFGDEEMAARVGEVDAIFHFDTLLHQVAPDWDGVLELWAPRARLVLVSQPQWLGERTVRLLDLGLEEYQRVVNPPGTPLDPGFEAKLEEYHPERGRRWRDMDGIWQWGITDDDLVATMRRLGFSPELFRNWGGWHGLERFERHAFLFARRDRQ